MTMIHLRMSDKIYICPFKAKRFGVENWGIYNSFDQIIEEDVGRGDLFEQTPIYVSFRRVFSLGHQWEDTPFFRQNARKIEQGVPLWRCTSREELLHRLNTDIRGLHASMKQFGFLSQARIEELAGRDSVERETLLPFLRPDYPARLKPSHEIKIGINELGELLFLDGRHRLSIARVLGIEDIPARVVFRHSKMIAVREQLQQAALADLPGDPQYRPTHPDLRACGLSAASVESVSRRLSQAGLPVPGFEAVPA
ncbi:MAG: hypothetical protein ACK4LQ_15230 [Pararhodobacter sp.]